MAALSATALPGLLLQLHRQSFEGWLQLQRGALRRRYAWRGGVPTGLESTEPGDALVERLIAQGHADPSVRARLARLAEQEPAPELRQLVALKAATPRELLSALSLQLRDTLLDCMSWDAGEATLEPQDLGGGALPSAPLDLRRLAAEGVARSWRPHQVFEALGENIGRAAVASEALATLRPSLPDTPAIEELLRSLDGRESAFQLLCRLADPMAHATLWLLHAEGALSWQTPPPRTAEPDETHALSAEEPELEIEVVATGSRTDPARPRAREPQPEREADAQTAALREEILTLHGRLDELDCWELLGVDRETPPPKIKRAYLKAAKRLHPDKVVQAGLEEVKSEANAIFAAITRAHEVLTDPDKRRAYEATLEGHTVIDAESLAQAETCFRKGEILMRAGNFRDALELLEAAVRLWPKEADYQAALAWTLYKKNPPEDERALEHFEKALSLDDRQAQVHLRYSVVLKAVGQLEKAEREAARGRELDPNARA